MHKQEIPLVHLDTEVPQHTQHYCTALLQDEINGIQVEHVAITANNSFEDSVNDGYKAIYLFVKGTGEITIDNTTYDLAHETIFLPNAVENFTVTTTNDDTLHYLKISCQLSAQDHIDLQALPAENTQQCYFEKFTDCQSYSEAIKSPNTVSRTILSNEYIPRVAMGTVHTKGPDKVATHEHPMLEQLFLGLSENNCIVYADENQVEFPQHSVLHIPLGSSHSVSVEQDQVMHYVWMDFFLDKQGEKWLETHQVDSEQ